MPLSTSDLLKRISADVANIRQVSAPDRSDRRTWFVVFGDDTRWRYADDPARDSQTGARIRQHMDGFAFNVPLAGDVKAEARRRILARYPDWKQANMTAQGVELVNIRVSIGSWTERQAQEAAALSSAWDWIKSVRSASDRLEAMSPIPSDYQSDAYWPAGD